MTKKDKLKKVSTFLRQSIHNGWGDLSPRWMQNLHSTEISCGVSQLGAVGYLVSDALRVYSPEYQLERVSIRDICRQNDMIRDIAPLLLKEIRAYKGAAGVIFSDRQGGLVQEIGEAMVEHDPEHVTKVYLGTNPNSGNPIYTYTVQTKISEQTRKRA